MMLTDHPVPDSAHPGVEGLYAHLDLLPEDRPIAGSGYFPDFSEFNGAVDWTAAGAAYRAGTISGVAIRAGFGTVRADARFAANQAGARAQGIPVIYYWFCYPAYNTPQAEAAMFNATVGPLQPGEAMCGDFEDDPQAHPFPRGQAGVDWCRAFLTALEAPQNATWWYTYPSLLMAVGLQVLMASWPFWEADYSATPDSAFAPAIARQFTDCGSTPGVGGCCDQSRVLRAPLSQWLTGGLDDMFTDDDRRMLTGLFNGWFLQDNELKALQAGQTAAKTELDTLTASVTALQAAGVPPATLQPVLDSIAKLGAHLGVGTA